jgi:AbrB family looped-hinge helix DNA binding protein
MRVKVTSKRQVTFPAKVLDAMGVKPGDHLEITETTDGFLLQPKRIDLSKLAYLRDKIDPNTPPLLDFTPYREGEIDLTPYRD